MLAEKRSTNDLLNPSQILKRQRSDSNMGSNSALTVASGTGRNAGALIQSVGLTFVSESHSNGAKTRLEGLAWLM